jgi:membrane protein YdbS with pleckstrin-like domain
MTKKEEINDKLVRWNDIFSDLTIDALDLINDIKEMINYILVSAVLLISMGISAVLIAFLRHMEPKYLAASVVIFIVTVVNASQIIRKWLKLRIRYDKLRSIQEGLD